MWSNVFMIAGLRRGRDAARPRRRRRDRQRRDPARRSALGARGLRDRGHAGEAGRSAVALGAERAIDYHERGLRRGARREARRRGRHPRQHGRAVPRAQRRGAGHRGPPRDHRHAGRSRRASSTSTACCGKRGAVIATSLRARPARGEGGDLRGRASSTSGRCRERARCARSCTRRCRSTEAADAHRLMESGAHSGKILLVVGRATASVGSSGMPPRATSARDPPRAADRPARDRPDGERPYGAPRRHARRRRGRRRRAT